MKKVLLIATLTAVLSSLSGFAQGYFTFTGGPRSVWDAWSGSSSRPDASNRLAFVWGTGTPLISSIMPSVPTNNAVSIDRTAAWNAILNDPNFHLALNNTDGSLVSVQSAGNGGWSYSTGATFPVTGTAVGAWQVYVIGWDYNYATPAAAQTAGALLGWSGVFTYNAVSQIGTPLSMSQSGFLPFGVGAVPEPGTFALAGLGAAAMLIFRRRK